MSILRNPFVIAAVVILLLLTAIALYFDHEPSFMQVNKPKDSEVIVGVATTQVLIDSVQMLMDKPGGYLSNDVMPNS